jgi:dipeptidyl aminopeptidase/acylaminoacyl peptidase
VAVGVEQVDLAEAGQDVVDPAVVWGQSAGGYLAAMTGTTNGLSQFNTGANLGQSRAPAT